MAWVLFVYLLILLYFRSDNLTRSLCDQTLLFGSRDCQDRENTESTQNFTEENKTTNIGLIPGKDYGITIVSHQNSSLKIVAILFIVLSVVFCSIFAVILIRRHRTSLNVTRSNKRKDKKISETPKEYHKLINIKVLK